MIFSSSFQCSFYNQLNHDVLQMLKGFLSVNELVTVVEDVKTLTTNPYLQINVEVFEHTADKGTSLVIEHHPRIDERLRNLFRTELNKEKILFQLKEMKHSPLASSRSLFFKYYLPPNPSLEVYKELFSMCIARVILRYADRQQNSFFSYFPKHMLENWLISMTQTQILPEPNKAQQKEENEIEKEENSHALKLISQNTLDEKKRILHAEVFFDYTILPPQSESERKEYLVEGNLYIKNTGNQALINPVICIKITPIQSASLQGQIIPAKMVSSLGTKSMSGEKGWKYVYDDWRQRVKTNGEYWITPIQVLHIPPRETTAFNFKMTIDEPKERMSFIAQGFVYFQEEKKQFHSNNQISISF